MGMDGTIQGHEVKVRGLPAKAILELAIEHQGEPLFSGVDLIIREGSDPSLGGTITLNYAESLAVAKNMRRHLLDGYVYTYTAWADSYGKPEPIANLQDIWRFQDDVNVYAWLAEWLSRTDGSEVLFFA